MDATLAAFVALGAVAGFFASAVPGFHVNALAILVASSWTYASAHGVAFLVAALAASPFGLALPATFLGASSDDDALQSLPAQKLAAEGRGAEALALQAWGAMLGLLVALPLAFASRPAWGWLAPRLSMATGWLVLGVALLLVLSDPCRPAIHRRAIVVPDGVPGTARVSGVLSREGERIRIGGRSVDDPHGLLESVTEGESVAVRIERVWRAGPASPFAGKALAAFVLVLAGALGLVALPLGARSPIGLPASPLLPLLAGLFAAPVLVAGALGGRGKTASARLEAPRRGVGALLKAAWPGAAASSLLGLVPGVSASHAALLTRRGATPEGALVRLAAVNGGAVVFTLLAWHVLGRARAGALVTANAFAVPVTWRSTVPPGDAWLHLEIVLAAGLFAMLLARWLTRPVGRASAWLGPRRAARAGMVVLVGLVALSTGLVGLVEFGAAAATGSLPGRWRLRRGLLMGVILVPALVRAFAG